MIFSPGEKHDYHVCNILSAGDVNVYSSYANSYGSLRVPVTLSMSTTCTRMASSITMPASIFWVPTAFSPDLYNYAGLTGGVFSINSLGGINYSTGLNIDDSYENCRYNLSFRSSYSTNSSKSSITAKLITGGFALRGLMRPTSLVWSSRLVSSASATTTTMWAVPAAGLSYPGTGSTSGVYYVNSFGVVGEYGGVSKSYGRV